MAAVVNRYSFCDPVEMEIDPRIGPHEGREFELLDKREKHVALFYEIIPEDCAEYKAREDYGALEWEITAEAKGRPIVIPYVILFRRSYESAARRLQDIIREFDRGNWEALERETGAILGYPEDAVEYYIKRCKRNK